MRDDDLLQIISIGPFDKGSLASGALPWKSRSMAELHTLVSTPIRSVLVALPAGSGAVLLDRLSALALARPYSVVLLQVAPLPATSRQPCARRSRARLAVDVQRLSASVDSRDIKAIFSTRPALHEIIEEARAARAELILMAGETGAIAQRVTASTGVPVLLVRQTPPQRYRRPLIALDPECDGYEVLACALRLLVRPRPPLAIVYAYALPNRIALPPSLCQLQAWRRVHWLLARARLSSPQSAETWVCELRHGDARSVIPCAAQSSRCDLVIVGVRERSHVARVLRGSTAIDLSRAVTCDVLFVPTMKQGRRLLDLA